VDENLINQVDTKFYTTELHRAAFALPAFVRKVEKFAYKIEISFFSLGTQ
jgi:hypothetical protein